MPPRFLAIAAFLALALLFAACSGDDDDDSAEVADSTPSPASITLQNQPDPVQAPNGPPSEPQEGTFEIVAEDTAFQGNSVSAVVGQVTVIRVANRDQLTHNLRIAGLDGQYDTEDDAVTEPDAIEPGSSGELSFAPAIPGAYTFRCDFHPGSMGGQIVAQ
jgi:plastocyanin